MATNEVLLPNFTILFHQTLGLIGFGKSSAVLIISPLVSLMVDQVPKLRSRDMKTFISLSSTGIVAMAQELLATDSSLQNDYRKSGKFRCLKSFVVAQVYEIKSHQIFTLRDIKNICKNGPLTRGLSRPRERTFSSAKITQHVCRFSSICNVEMMHAATHV